MVSPTIVITVLVLATIALAAWLARRTFPAHVVFDANPDAPLPFGYRMAWLAIRSSDTRAVAEALGLTHIAMANWRTGLGAVYSATLGETHVFVSPPVQGWTFVAGLTLPHPLGRGFEDRSTPMLLELGARFPDVQYYFAYPTVDFFAWARIRGGRLERAFAIGETGVLWNKGRLTPEEHALGLKLFELRGVRDQQGAAGGEMLLHPTEAHVLRLAASWSLDPSALSERSAPARLGLVGLSNRAWRPRRLERAA